MTQTISFKSTEENYRKEESGIKPNTVRFTDDWTPKRWIEYEQATHVKIRMKEHGRTHFTRAIKDKTKHKNVVIISW